MKLPTPLMHNLDIENYLYWLHWGGTSNQIHLWLLSEYYGNT